MFVVDTNILLYAVNRDSSEHVKAKKALESYMLEVPAYCLSWGIIYEFFRVATHSRIFRRPLTFEQANRFIDDLIGEGNALIIGETELHQKLIIACKQKVHRLSGNLLHDFHTAVLMYEHGIKDIVTLDSDFRAFSWLNIINL